MVDDYNKESVLLIALLIQWKLKHFQLKSATSSCLTWTNWSDVFDAGSLEWHTSELKTPVKSMAVLFKISEPGY